MRKGLLAVFSGGIGCVMMVIFGVSIAWQCIPVYAAQTLQLQDPPVILPCGVDGTELVAKHLVYYEGPYWESGGQEVAGVAALLVENAGCLMVAHGAVMVMLCNRSPVNRLPLCRQQPIFLLSEALSTFAKS